MAEEINGAFQTNNFFVLDVLHIFDPHYISQSIDKAAAKDASIVCDWHWINKIDIYDCLKKESAAFIGCARKTFLNEFKKYSTPIEINFFFWKFLYHWRRI